MAKQEMAARAVAALDFLQTAASSKIAQHMSMTRPSLTFAVTAVAGLVVAAALGGTLVFSLSRKQRKRHPLTSKQWGVAFDAESGRLINQKKVLDKVRFGGIEPHIRAEVWPFLLGFYGLGSTREERESEKCRKREMYMGLKIRCNALRAKISKVMPESDEGNTSTDVSYEEWSSSPEEAKRAGLTQEDPSFTCKNSEDTDDGSKREFLEADEGASVGQDTKAASASDKPLVSGSSNDTEDGSQREFLEADDGASVGQDTKVASASEKPLMSGSSNAEDADESVLSTKVRADMENDCLKVTDEFVNCQRIIRLDAVRMNAEWVPYSPSQANVTKELAFELARSVELKDDEHLEPCRQHHAARLVAILEAYALHDTETGYCQGMSDLLSPFVALFDEDYEAFWCFVQFMNTARFNFRSDEIGIRRQLNKISSIFKAGDPQLYAHLESIDAGNCFFVYRMVVVLLRRELTFEQTISLWEVLWAEKRALGLGNTTCKVRRHEFLAEDLLLYVIAAAVRQKRKVIIEKCRGLDEVLRECNSLAGHLDVLKLLKDARDLAYAVNGQI